MRGSYRNFDFATTFELAEREGIAPCYPTRFLWLTQLALVAVGTILEAKQRPKMTLELLLNPFATE